jgi:hypothetical protein
MTVRRIRSLAVMLGVAMMHNAAPQAALSQSIARTKSSADTQSRVTCSSWANLVPQVPPNISVPDSLRPILYDILKKSPTFRRQCLQLSRSHNLRIDIKIVGAIPQTHCLALSRATRFADGQVMLTMMIVAARGNYVELLGHEFEHALEQAEGLDLKALAATSGDRVYQLEDGSFETQRARRVGLTVAREFHAFRHLSLTTSAVNNVQVQP